MHLSNSGKVPYLTHPRAVVHQGGYQGWQGWSPALSAWCPRYLPAQAAHRGLRGYLTPVPSRPCCHDGAELLHPLVSALSSTDTALAPLAASKALPICRSVQSSRPDADAAGLNLGCPRLAVADAPDHTPNPQPLDHHNRRRWCELPLALRNGFNRQSQSQQEHDRGRAGAIGW